MVIENTFGLMASRFQVFHTEISLNLEIIETVQDGSEEERSDILTPLRGHNRHAGEEGRAVREKFLHYFR